MQVDLKKLLISFCGLCSILSLQPIEAADHCVILQYHHFSEHTPHITSVTPAQFDAHLDYLKKNEFQVLPLDEVVSALQAGRSLPDRCVSLTVDDAYDSVYEAAYPRLKSLGWPLTVFVNTEAVDQGVPAYMSWQQMREMSAGGVRFENHSHSHAHLIRRLADENDAAWEQRIRQDVQRAQQRISDEIGRTPVLFAYPYGEYTESLANLVAALGLIGFGQQSGPAWSGSDFTALPRFPMAAGYADMPGFRTKVNTLPMPVRQIVPVEPLVPVEEWRPQLALRLQAGSYQKDAIRCYANGSADVDLQWPADQPDTLLVRSNNKLQVGRSRYNCTMPSGQRGRYHWYSHDWIRRQADGGWYQE